MLRLLLLFEQFQLVSTSNLFHFILFSLCLPQLTAEQCKLLLIQAICDILKKCKDDKFRIVTLPDEDTVPSLLTTTTPTTATPAQEAALNQVPAEASSSILPSANVCQTHQIERENFVEIF